MKPTGTAYPVRMSPPCQGPPVRTGGQNRPLPGLDLGRDTPAGSCRVPSGPVGFSPSRESPSPAEGFYSSRVYVYTYTRGHNTRGCTRTHVHGRTPPPLFALNRSNPGFCPATPPSPIDPCPHPAPPFPMFFGPLPLCGRTCVRSLKRRGCFRGWLGGWLEGFGDSGDLGGGVSLGLGFC